MPLPLQEHVRQVLLENGRDARIHHAVHEGWRSFQDNYPQRHQWRRKATSREIVWEEVTQRLAVLASNDQGVAFIEHKDTVSLIIDDEVLLRLKHADTSLMTSNYPTAEAEAFDDHEAELYGYTGLQRVKLCYVPDQFERDLIWTGIAASVNGRFLWKIELDGKGAVEAPVALPLVEPEQNTAKLAKLKGQTSEQGRKKKNDGA
ncbi:MAG: hypothetical protein AAFQ05_04625 [Pseudomonadota bacterium]